MVIIESETDAVGCKSFPDFVEPVGESPVKSYNRPYEASIRYTKLDGEAVSIPVTTIIERDGETVTASRIYGDMAPLYDVDPDEAPLIC